MRFYRLGRLLIVPVCACALGAAALFAQQPAPKPAEPAQQQPQQTKPEPKQANPFETVPTAKEPEPQQPKLQPPPKGEAPAAAPVENDQIEAIEFRGARRVPQDTLRALIHSRVGDKLNDDTIQRDFSALWNSHRFDDLKVEKLRGEKGWILRWEVTERPVVRSITYEGNKSVSVSDILDRYKERKVGLVVESQYDPAKIQRARNVLLELLAERGHQYATVTPELHQVPPASLSLIFKVNEGPTVKVGQIDIENNKVFSERIVKRAMKNSHPIGIPYSILFEDLFARTYDSSKLDEDKERVRDFYQQNGYFLARVEDSKVNIRDTGGQGFRIPLLYPNKPGKRADITIYLDEGRKYSLGKVTFTGVKLFKTPNALMRPLFGMTEGDTFSTEKVRKGVKNAQKLYGEFGYIDAVVEPDFDPHSDTGTLDMTLNVDEGKQFFVRRIDFSGNTTTRDKVIRRELLIDEGDLFNTRLWEISILRLNQLGYFEPLKEEEAADIKRDTKTNTVDLTLKVKERGKNSVQLNGGVSALAGSFIGFSYATNNFLGLGETLSLSTQLGTMQRAIQFGFTEPYFLDRPIQSGFTLYLSRFNYDQARQASVLAGYDLTNLYNQLGQQNLLNYVSNSYGGTIFASYQLRRSFARVGLSYGYDVSNIKTLTQAAGSYFDYLDFQGVGGPNSLDGIRTSKLTPSFTYNTVNHPITPTAGKSIFASIGMAGLGGNVNTLEPTLDLKYFRHGFWKGNVIGMHLLGRFLTGYGGKVAPPFSRYYIGGENDVRGFDIWGISPFGFIPSTAQLPVLNADGTQRTQKFLGAGGVPVYSPVQMTIPIYQLVAPGGDTNLTANFEYRIPLVGPVTLAPFFDAGLDKLSLPGQLKLNPGRVDQLNAQFPQANFDGRVQIAPGTQKIRMSTGIELQVLLPVVNAPFRVYWAFNPSIVRENLVPPLAVDQSLFPNKATFDESIQYYGRPFPLYERRSTFRFSVGRTF
ncbi:MAG TPA: outer membrane protein assembly factor BamA [Bryobacteraceae bacterium]|nr:outer membrane protein assembly factor BamA [Bryobacteraceae bacterium]